MTARPAFLITIDTEGDDVWSRPREVATRNARFLPRFQALCERHGFPPTYLVNREMALDPAFRDFGRDVLARSTAEIGMHMHPWDTPPLVPLGARDWHDQPYAVEYPPDLVGAKAETVTRLLEDVFGIHPTSHRAGRWGFDASYARALARLGYRVDCSVTPGITWRHHPGHPGGPGGADFTGFPDGAYELDLDRIDRPGRSGLVEVPMTIVRQPRPWHREVARRLLRRTGPRLIWLRPDGANLADLHFVHDLVRRERRPYLQFTLHSSEFMPGGSPTFPTPASIEVLYAHLEELFGAVAVGFEGRTLSDYAREVPSAPSS